MSTNSLQAVLNKQTKETEEKVITESKEERVPKTQKKKFKSEIDREKKVLIGGHFSKGIAKQLKLIAVEEETTNQQLLSEALDLLFVKKGKSKIKDI